MDVIRSWEREPQSNVMSQELSNIGDGAVAAWARRDRAMEQRLETTAYIMSRAMAAANKLDMNKITFVQVDPAAKVVSVLEKRVDALLGGADDQFFLIKYKGEEPAALRYANYGANIVGMTIVGVVPRFAICSSPGSVTACAPPRCWSLQHATTRRR